MIFKKKQKKIQWFDDYIKEMISSQTGFDVKKIKPMVALKTNPKRHNQFDSFDFEYENKIYRLEKGKLVDEKYI